MRSKICDLLYKNAKFNPDKIAIFSDKKTIDYKNFSKLVSKISNAFIHNNIGYKDHIGMLLDNSIDTIAILFSCAELGICVIPLNTTLPFTAIESALEYTNTVNIISNKKTLMKHNIIIKSKKYNILCLDSDLSNCISLSDLESFSCIRPEIDIISDDIPYILSMSSGSTGNPKAIELTQKNKVDRIFSHVDEFAINSDDRIMVSTSIAHSLAERMSLLTIVTGGSLILIDENDIEKWFTLSKKYFPTFTVITPYQITNILDFLKNHNEKVESYQKIISSSDYLNKEIKEEALKFFDCDLYEIYGTTETSTVTIKKMNRHSDNNGIGFPFYSSKIKILSDDGSASYDYIAKPFEIGEIICKTDLIANGYYNSKTQFSMSFFEDYFKTGDLGFIDDKGELHFISRKKEIIKNGTMIVYPNDIEEVIRQMPEIEECAAFSHPNANNCDSIGIAIIPSIDSKINIDYIYNYCKNNLADFQQPNHIYVVDKLPKNAMGKVQRLNIYNYLLKYGYLKGANNNE